MPPKGDVGGIAAAMYMLCCGDILRWLRNEDMKTFSIDLNLWCDLLRNGGSWYDKEDVKDDYDYELLKGVDKKDIIKDPEFDETDENNDDKKMAAGGGKDESKVVGTISFIQVCRNYTRNGILPVSYTHLTLPTIA